MTSGFPVRERLRLLLPLLVLVGLSGCASLLEKVQGLARPSARVEEVSILSLSLTQVTLDFDVVVENPASVPLPLLDLTYRLESGGATFLSGETGVVGSVPAQGERHIPVPVSVDFATALRLLSGVYPGAILPYRAELEISVDAPAIGPLTLPLRHESELPIPSVPTLDVATIDWGQVSLTRVGGIVRINVRNPNDFAVELQSFTGGLRLGGRSVADLAAAPGVELGRGASTVVELPLSFAPAELGASLLDLVRGESSAYALEGRLQLDTRFGGLILPYRSEGEVPFRR